MNRPTKQQLQGALGLFISFLGNHAVVFLLVDFAKKYAENRNRNGIPSENHLNPAHYLMKTKDVS